MFEIPEKPTTFPQLICSNGDIEKVEAFMFAVSKMVPCFEQSAPVWHRFQDGVYIREILMQPGQFVVGHEHLTEHYNLIMSGSATVLMEDQVIDGEPGMTIKSRVGTRKMLIIHEPTRWITIHKNPKNYTVEQMAEFEAELFRPSQTFLAHHASLK